MDQPNDLREDFQQLKMIIKQANSELKHFRTEQNHILSDLQQKIDDKKLIQSRHFIENL